MAPATCKIRDLMVDNVRTVPPDMSALRAAEMMVRSGIRHLVVVDDDRHVLGVLSERNVLKHLSPWLSKYRGEFQITKVQPHGPVRDIMSDPPIVITEETPLRKAAGLLADRKIGCLPVVDARDRLIGIVSNVDLLRFLSSFGPVASDDEFQVFSPPAYFDDASHLMVPAGYLADREVTLNTSAVLAFAAESQRIGIKLLEVEPEKHQPTHLHGARPASVVKEHLRIPALDFCEHFQLVHRGPFDVNHDEKTGYLVLTPSLVS